MRTTSPAPSSSTSPPPSPRPPRGRARCRPAPSTRRRPSARAARTSTSPRPRGCTTPASARPPRAPGCPYAGRDGKTGQTLLRSVLAPMFAQRALPVRAWSGTNLLGGGDGAALADPGRRGGEERGQGAGARRQPRRTPRRGAAHRRRARRSATGRPPGTTSPSTASSARGWSSRPSGRAATRPSPRPSCSTSPASSARAHEAGSAGPSPGSASTSRTRTAARATCRTSGGAARPRRAPAGVPVKGLRHARPRSRLGRTPARLGGVHRARGRGGGRGGEPDGPDRGTRWRRAPRCACTRRAWRSTTGPTGRPTPSSAPAVRCPRAGSPRRRP